MQILEMNVHKLLAVIFFSTTKCFSFSFIEADSNWNKEREIPSLPKLLSIIQQLQWKSVVLHADKEFLSRNFLKYAAQYFTSTGVIPILKHNDSSALHYYLSCLHAFPSVIIVWCQYCHETIIINKAMDLQMFTRRFRWIFVMETEIQLKNSLVSVGKVIRADSIVYALTSNTKVLIPVCCCYAEVKDSQEGTYDILRVFRQFSEQQAGAAVHASFGMKNGLIKWQKNSRLPLEDYRLKIGVLTFPPFNIGRLKPSMGGGYMDEIVLFLSESTGFKYSYVFEESGVYGMPSVNGTWNGIMGMIANKKVDIGAVGFSMFPERMKIAEFSTFVVEVGMALVIRRPALLSEGKYTTTTYKEPLSDEVWLTIIATWLTSSILLAYISYLRPSRLTSMDLNPAKVLLQNIWSLLAIFSQQVPLPYVCENKPFRIVMLCYLVCTLLILRFYGSVLIASLTVQKSRFPYQDAKDLLSAGYEIGTLASSSIIYQLQDAKAGVLQEVWTTMQSNDDLFAPSAADGFTRAFQKKYAFIIDEVYANTMLETNCSFVTLPSDVYFEAWNFALTKNSEYSDIFSRYILYMRETGLLQKLRIKHLSTSSRYCDAVKSSKQFGLKKTIGAFAPFVFGAALAFLILVLEVVVNRMRRFCKYRE